MNSRIIITKQYSYDEGRKQGGAKTFPPFQWALDAQSPLPPT